MHGGGGEGELGPQSEEGENAPVGVVESINTKWFLSF